VTIVCFCLCSWWWGRKSWVGHMICQQANKRVGSVMVVIVDSHLVIMSVLGIGSSLDFEWLFTFVLSLCCVYLCSHLSCTFDGWVPILDFLFTRFFFLRLVANTWVLTLLHIFCRVGGVHVENSFGCWNFFVLWMDSNKNMAKPSAVN